MRFGMIFAAYPAMVSAGRGEEALDAEIQIERLLYRFLRLFLFGFGLRPAVFASLAAKFLIQLAGVGKLLRPFLVPVRRLHLGLVAGPSLANLDPFGLLSTIQRIANLPGPFVVRFEGQLALLPGLQNRSFRNRVERRDPLQLIGEPFRIVRDEIRAVARPADRNIEALLVHQVGVARGHRGDDPVHGPALESMDRGRPGTVEMTNLGIAFPEFHRRTVLETEAEAVLPDRFHCRDLPVGEPGGGIVAREAHLVPTSKLQALAPKELDTAPGRRDTAGFPFEDIGTKASNRSIYNAGIDFVLTLRPSP